MEKRKSPDGDKENEIKKLQEKLKASGTKLQTSFQEYRKKIEASKNSNTDDFKNKSQSPAPSTSSDLKVHAKGKGFTNNEEENYNSSKRTTVSKTKLNSESSISNGSLNSYNTHNQGVSRKTFKSQNHEIIDKSEMKDKIKQIKSKISRFNRNNNECNRYPTADPNIGRNRSISERSSSTASTNYNSNFSSANVRQRSISGNYSTANSDFSNANFFNGNFILNESKPDASVSNEGSVKARKRSRGKRGSKSKSKETQANAEHIPYYAKECDNLYINAETLLILDLLILPLEQHTDYLLNLAKVRKIILPNADSEGYVYNPELKRLNKILQLGNQCRNLNTDDIIKIENLLSKNRDGIFSGTAIQQRKQPPRLRLDSESKRNGERRTKTFEDYVNEIVGEDLPDDKKAEFLFPKLPKAQRTKNYYTEPKFEAELEKFAQKLVDANLGVIVEGDIRINGKNNDQAFVKNVAGKKDAFLYALICRKYALHGDIVRIFVRNDDNEKQTTNKINNDIICVQDDNTDSLEGSDKRQSSTTNQKSSTPPIDPQPGPSSQVYEDNVIENDLNSSNDNNVFDPNDELEELNTTLDLLEQDNETVPEKSSKAFVIKIVQHVHNRKCVGNFLSYRKNSEYITFVPRDLKMPNIRVFKQDWPEAFKKGELENISDVLYVAQITDWQNGICIGKVLSPIGKCGELESENKAILLQNGLEMDPYEEKFNEMFYGPLIITDEDLKMREDLRSECIFTIDPLTARDLDDALSCKTLSNGNYEIGVHISDVTHFLEEKSELDEIVVSRSTSVYMVNEVFHMLPKPLCFKCSLLPGEDKFAFSCFWEVTPSGDIKSTRMSRTILNSCTQFAYEHAQKIIDNPNKTFMEDEFPQIHNGWTVRDIVDRINILQDIAEIWREKRFDKGALKINRPKLYFHLDADSGEPSEYFQAILQTANFLIEEFMLMANQSIADFIYKKYPEIAFLRNHEPPLPNVIQKVHTKLKQLGLNLDITSSKSIYSSLTDLIRQSDNPQTLEVCLAHLISKPMTRAKYFCSENAKTPDEFWHYALSIPIYTHFTSPIRRYPDILVHRVLAAALGYNKAPERTPSELHTIASICNEKKYTAKLAGEDSSNLYFMYHIKSKKSVLMRAAVLELFFRSMEIILLESGHQIRVSYPNEKSNTKIIFNSKSKTAMLVKDQNEPVELKPFSEINIEVYVEKFKIKARLPGTGRKQLKSENADNIEANTDLNVENNDVNIETNIETNASSSPNQQKESKESDLESNQSIGEKELIDLSASNDKEQTQNESNQTQDEIEKNTENNSELQQPNRPEEEDLIDFTDESTALTTKNENVEN